MTFSRRRTSHGLAGLATAPLASVVPAVALAQSDRTIPLILNKKKADAYGITIPRAALLRADSVI